MSTTIIHGQRSFPIRIKCRMYFSRVPRRHLMIHKLQWWSSVANYDLIARALWCFKAFNPKHMVTTRVQFLFPKNINTKGICLLASKKDGTKWTSKCGANSPKNTSNNAYPPEPIHPPGLGFRIKTLLALQASHSLWWVLQRFQHDA
jgi:hypothetical protein